jgi:hypothetical protein
MNPCFAQVQRHPQPLTASRTYVASSRANVWIRGAKEVCYLWGKRGRGLVISKKTKNVVFLSQDEGLEVVISES